MHFFCLSVFFIRIALMHRDRVMSAVVKLIKKDSFNPSVSCDMPYQRLHLALGINITLDNGHGRSKDKTAVRLFLTMDLLVKNINVNQRVERHLGYFISFV